MRHISGNRRGTGRSVSASRAPIELLEARWLLATTVLSTGTGEGSLQITVDSYGSYGSSGSGGDAIYQPVGVATSNGTTFASAVYFAPANTFLSETGVAGGSLTGNNFTSTSPTSAVSSFSVSGYDITLTQTAIPAGGAGAILSQEYTITNNTGSAQTPRMVRFVDGDLHFLPGANNDFAAALTPGALLEFDTATDPNQTVGYFLVASLASNAGGLVQPGTFTVQNFPFSGQIVQNNGIPAVVAGQVVNDANHDGFSDSGSDVTLSNQVDLPIGAGETAVYTTTTIFSQGAPFTVAQPPPVTQTGSLDTSFGTGGAITSPFAIESVAQQADGKFVAAGHVGSFADFTARSVLARYNADGSLDTSFGDSGQVVIGLIPLGSDTPVSMHRGVAIAADGKIVVVGEALNDAYVARYNPDGKLDSTFGTGGVTLTNFGGAERADAVAIQADGKIVASGTADGAAMVLRYTTDGVLDAPFGNRQNGAFVGNLTPGNDEFGSVVVRPDGAIFAGGTRDGQFLLCKFQPNGLVDPTWIPAPPFNNVFAPALAGFTGLPTDERVGLALAANDKIVCVSGTDTGDMAVWRLDNVGNIDTAFPGNFGTGFFQNAFLRRDLGATDDADNVVVLPDGRYLVISTSTNGAVAALAIAAFNIDGTVDTSFGEDGVLLVPQTIASRALHIGNLAAQTFAGPAATGGFVVGFAQQSETSGSQIRRISTATQTITPPVTEGSFGTVNGKRNQTLKNVADPDGSTFNVLLRGPGTGQVQRSSSGVSLIITGATSGSSLVITANKDGNGRANLTDIIVTGGTLGTIQGRTADISGAISIPGIVKTITLGTLQAARVGVGGAIGTFTAGDVANSTIASAGPINKLTLNSAVTSQIFSGASLGADIALGGFGADADSFGPGRINNAKIIGAFNSSYLIVGSDPVDGVLVNGNDVFSSPSQLKAFAAGSVGADSRIVAQLLPSKVLIGKSSISPVGDPRFVSA